MTPRARPTAEQVADPTRRTAAGAARPGVEGAAIAETAAGNGRYDELRRTHRAWQPDRRPAAPEVRNKMGGGGLDYCDPARLVRLGAGPVAAAADPDHDRRVAEATRACETARDEFRKIRGPPGGRPSPPTASRSGARSASR